MNLWRLFENRVIQSPGRFHPIIPHKKSQVSHDDILQQSFIGVRKRSEGLGITEMQFLRLQADQLAGLLHFKVEIKAFVRLDSDHYGVAMVVAALRGPGGLGVG